MKYEIDWGNVDKVATPFIISGLLLLAHISGSHSTMANIYVILLLIFMAINIIKKKKVNKNDSV